MVLPALAALGRLAARAVKRGDYAYNARRRYTRRAEKLYKQADKATGETAERLRGQAEVNLKDAVRLYENERDRAKFEAKMKTKYGVDLTNVKAANPAQRAQLMNESYDALRGATRERMVKEIMNGPAGKRIMASTADIWKKAIKTNENGERVVDMDMAYRLIMKHFGVDSMADVIDIYEDELGEDLYSDPESEERYREVVAAATEFVRDLNGDEGE